MRQETNAEGVGTVGGWLEGILELGENVLTWAFTTGAGATIVIGLFAAAIAVWAIVSNRSISRRQSTVDTILRMEHDEDVINARRKFIELANGNGGLARFAHDAPFSDEENEAFEARIAEYLQEELKDELRAENFAQKLIEELPEFENPDSMSAFAAKLSESMNLKISPAVVARVAKKVADRRSEAEEWKSSRDAIRRVLNEFEIIAIGIHRGALDYTIYEHWSKTMIKNYFAKGLPYIAEIRAQHGVQTYYQEFEALAREMSASQVVKRKRWWALLW